MGTRQARLLRRIEAARGRYVGTLLVLGLPPVIEYDEKRGRISASKRGDTHQWYSADYREKVRQFYISAHVGTSGPSVKTTKKFVRGYMAWLRRETDARGE